MKSLHFDGKWQNHYRNLGLLTPGLVLLKLHQLSHFEKNVGATAAVMHTPSPRDEWVHSSCHGILTYNFLLEITQIPSLFIEC